VKFLLKSRGECIACEGIFIIQFRVSLYSLVLIEDLGVNKAIVGVDGSLVSLSDLELGPVLISRGEEKKHEKVKSTHNRSSLDPRSQTSTVAHRCQPRALSSETGKTNENLAVPTGIAGILPALRRNEACIT